MRRVPLILGLVLIVALVVHEVYDFLVTNEGVRYFSSDARRLIYVMLLGIAAGMIAFGISRLSPRSQRKLKLVGLGTLGVFVTGGYAFCAYVLSSAASVTPGADIRGWAVTVLVSGVVVAALVWFEFLQVLRQTR
jgi:hypothetical protein